MKKRFLCMTLAVAMIVSMIPTSAFAATATYNYLLTVRTLDVGGAGTDSGVFAGFNFYDYGNAASKIDNIDYDDFERGAQDTYQFSTNKADPWMIQEVYLRTDGKKDHSTWMPGIVRINVLVKERKTWSQPPYYIDVPIYKDMGTVDFSGTELNCGEATRDFSNMTKRKISSWGKFDNWTDISYLNSETTGSLSKTWDGMITDQYGTYNPFSLDDAPTLSCTSSNDAISATSGCYSFADGKTATPSFNMDYEKIYQEMLKEDIGKVIFTINLNFPARTTYTTDGYSNVHTETITVYRRSFETGNQSINLSPVYSPRTDFNYFNNDYDDVTITLEPTTIHLEIPTDAQKSDLTDNFNSTAALYAGNDTTKKLCDMSYTKSNGVLTFTGTIPKNATTNGEGVMLYLSNVYSEYGGYKYDLNSGGTTLSYYFSSYKADTKAPTVSTVDVNTTAYSVVNNLKPSHKFYMVGSETLYPEKGVEHTPLNEGYFNYELYQYNENTESYSNSKTQITNYMGSSDISYTTVKAPINTTVMKDTPINLKLYNKGEGRYKIRIYAYDDANNTLGGSRNYYDIENVLIDNLAPRVTVNEEQKNQAVDGTKSVNYTFNITDFSNQFINDANIWARAYYCFVPEEDVMPSPDVSNIESGELGTVIGQWAFAEGGSATTTAVLKINKDESFNGKLYYFTTDSCKNDSRIEIGSVSSRDISVSNKDSVDTLVYTPSNYAKPSYEISFIDGGSRFKTEYHWIANDNSGFNQNYITYTEVLDVGGAVQKDNAGTERTLNGVYTLEYKVTELSSGNYTVFTKDFTFDNSDNSIKFNWSSTHMKPAEYQQAGIQISDPSGIVYATYRIVNPDNSVIDNYDEVELNLENSPDGTMQVRETPKFFPDKSGVYGLRIYAEDNNGQTSQLTPDEDSDSMLFTIRAEKPTVISITDDAPNKGLTIDDNYTLTVSVEEPMLNANYVLINQIVKYRVSLDKTNYGSWQTADGYMAISGISTGTAITSSSITSSAIKMTHTFEIKNPVKLSQGENTIYVQTACMNVGDTTSPSSTLISKAAKDIINCDVTSTGYNYGTITWKLSTTESTSQPVTVYATIIDEKNTVVSAKMTDDYGQEYTWIEIVGNEYAATVTSSGIYTVTAINDKGDTWSQTITITNIDTLLPEITDLIYSTPLGTITSKSVNVQMIFSKSDVKVTGIELIGSLTSSDIVYTPGGTSIRFKKNGSVTVFFEDSQGNKGSDVITVSNIYSDPPRLKAIPVLSDDKLSVNITFAKETNASGVPYDLYRKLKDLYIFYGGVTYSADKANFKLKGNGEYKFTIYDKAGTTQYLNLTVAEIDDSVPKITQVTWSYDYYKKNEQGVWEPNSDSKTIVIGVDTSGKEAGYVIAEDANQVTNQNVTVTVKTDKQTTTIGSKDKLSNSTSMIYGENGLFNYNLQAVNGNSVSYGVDVEVIDKIAPVIKFTGGSELVFIEGMTPEKDSSYAYNIDKLMDYTAYDLKDGKKIELTNRVEIDYGSFDPVNIENNIFSRSNPYYINYKVYDAAGNFSIARRTIRLVGFYDTIVLINGSMPDSSNTATVVGDKMEITLKNFSGISYAKYDKGTYTMGQMKTRGMQIVERNGKYTLSNLNEGWYTIYLQTDKRDYFTVWVYVSNSK